jgi:hypothetical protein
MSIRALVENAASTDPTPKAAAPISRAAAADPVAQGAHGDQRSRDEEPIDVHDPQQLGAAGPEISAEVRQREVQHRQIHRVDQARQRDHGQADPVAARGSGCIESGGVLGHGPRSRQAASSAPTTDSDRSVRLWREQLANVIYVRASVEDPHSSSPAWPTAPPDSNLDRHDRTGYLYPYNAGKEVRLQGEER